MFRDSVTNNEVKIEGYSIIKNDMERTRGGVCMFIKNNISFNPREDLKQEHSETVWVELLLPKTKPIGIGTCYTPRNNHIMIFLITWNKLN